MLQKRPIILYVDDDPDDHYLVVEAIRDLSPNVRVACAVNGLEALRYLEGTSNGNEKPSLILLDINMPLLNGKATLEKIKSNPLLRSIPVVMFTTSTNEQDRLFCLKHGAADFVSKPSSQADLVQAMRRFLVFLGVAQRTKG